MRKYLHLVLIGFMGTGKSTLGKELSRDSIYPLIDLDQDIEYISDRSISEIFTSYGEGFFRRLEAERLQSHLTSSTPLILSTGGGVVLNPENVKQIMEYGFVVQTTTSNEEIIKRLKADQINRPLLANDVTESVNRLLKQREGLYNFADLVVDTTQIDLQETSKWILSEWKKVMEGMQ